MSRLRIIITTILVFSTVNIYGQRKNIVINDSIVVKDLLLCCTSVVFPDIRDRAYRIHPRSYQNIVVNISKNERKKNTLVLILYVPSREDLSKNKIIYQFKVGKFNYLIMNNSPIEFDIASFRLDTLSNYQRFSDPYNYKSGGITRATHMIAPLLYVFEFKTKILKGKSGMVDWRWLYPATKLPREQWLFDWDSLGIPVEYDGDELTLAREVFRMPVRIQMKDMDEYLNKQIKGKFKFRGGASLGENLYIIR